MNTVEKSRYVMNRAKIRKIEDLVEKVALYTDHDIDMDFSSRKNFVRVVVWLHGMGAEFRKWDLEETAWDYEVRYDKIIEMLEGILKEEEEKCSEN